MKTETKQFVVNFPKTLRRQSKGFFQLAKKNIVRGKGTKLKNLSNEIDRIVYGL